MDDVLTIAEVAAELKISEQAVRNWIDEGKLEAKRLGSHQKARIRIERAALDRFVQPTARQMTGTIRRTQADTTGTKASLR